MSTAFDSFFTSLRGKKIAVLGLGVSNRPLVKLLLEFGCSVIGCDRTPRDKVDGEVLELEKNGCALSLGDTYLDEVQADVLFRTPGMHPGHPAIQAMAAKGVEVLTCGTCLSYYGLADQLAVGSVTNMYTIVEKMTGAARLVKP